MRLDQYSNPIFNDKDLFDALYQGQILPPNLIVEFSPEVEQLEKITGLRFIDPFVNDPESSIEDFDFAMQSDWFMPDEYKNLDILKYVMELSPPENLERTAEELDAFAERNMLNLLRWLKYFVDTMRSKNIVWGLGRGSSVASYVLFLIGVHKIDSVKYELDWKEFLR